MSDGAFIAMIIAAALLVAAGALGIGLVIQRASCFERFEDSGLQTKWTVIGGCRVNVPGQGWIPSANYRVL